MSFLQSLGNKVWVEAKYDIFRSTSWVVDKLPVRVSYTVANVAGDVVYYTWKRHSANAVSNMRRVLGPGAPWQAVKRRSRDSFRNYAKTTVDFLRFPHMEPGDVDKAVPVRYGMEHLFEAQEKGHGALIISGHIGNWDLAAAIMVGYDLPLNVVSDTHEPEKMDDLVNGTRERAGMNIIRLEVNSLRQIFTALKKNEIVSILIDKPEPDQGVPVQFFGETAYLPSGPAAIALKTRPTLLVGYCLRMPGDKTFCGVVEPPIDYEAILTGDKDTDVQLITQKIASQIEAVIRKHPDQWFMFREMWPRTEEHDAEIRQKRFWGGKNYRPAVSSD